MRKYRIKPNCRNSDRTTVLCFHHYQFLYQKKSNINTLLFKKKNLFVASSIIHLHFKGSPPGTESRLQLDKEGKAATLRSLSRPRQEGRLLSKPASPRPRGRCYLGQFSGCARRWLRCWSPKRGGSSALDGCRVHGARLWRSPACGAAGWCRAVSSWEPGIFLSTWNKTQQGEDDGWSSHKPPPLLSLYPGQGSFSHSTGNQLRMGVGVRMMNSCLKEKGCDCSEQWTKPSQTPAASTV